MQTVILLGGLATRLRPYTEKIPKAMIDICGKPFLQHQIELLKKHGICDFVLCVGYKSQIIEDHFGDGSSLNVTLSYSHDGETLLGTGGALKRAETFLEDSFLVLYGDSFLPVDYGKIMAHYKKTIYPKCLMTVYKNEGNFDTSNVVFENNELLRYSKTYRGPEVKYIDYGLAALNKQVLDRIPSGTKVDLADLYSELVEKRDMAGYEVFERFFEIGTPESLEEFKYYFNKEVSG